MCPPYVPPLNGQRSLIVMIKYDVSAYYSLTNLLLLGDKKKMVQQGFHTGDFQELKDQNIKECKESAKAVGDLPFYLEVYCQVHQKLLDHHHHRLSSCNYHKPCRFSSLMPFSRPRSIYC